MDLTVKSDENVHFMIEEIKTKLRMASGAALRADHYNADHFDQVKDIYDMVMTRNNISISEMEAIVTELGKMRA